MIERAPSPGGGELVLSSPYHITLEQSSAAVDADLKNGLGFDTTAGPLTGERFYAIDAPEDGSTVSIGAPSGPNGKLTIEGKVRANRAINLRPPFAAVAAADRILPGETGGIARADGRQASRRARRRVRSTPAVRIQSTLGRSDSGAPTPETTTPDTR